VLTFFSAELHIGRCTRTGTAQFHHVYSESSSSFALLSFGRAGFCRCVYFTFFSTSTMQGENSCCEALVGYTFQSKNWAAKAVASAIYRMWCSLGVHAGCWDSAVQRFLARLPGSVRLTCTHSTPPERVLLRTKGLCGASGEATARGVNLYEDMAAAC